MSGHEFNHLGFSKIQKKNLLNTEYKYQSIKVM